MAIDQGDQGEQCVGGLSAGQLSSGRLSPGKPPAGQLSVGQLAVRARVRVDTVRYYERTGLLPSPARTDGDHRRYGAADVDRLLFIRGAQRLGLRLAEIRELIAVRDTGTCPCGPAEPLLRGHLDETEREIARLEALRAQLTVMLEGLAGPSSCPDPVPGTWCPPSPVAEGGDRDVLVLR
ncbi:MAG TPA: MerR family DNA-binding protein [Trebonia sp.]|jgi:DNA-binding transcriptional MerR regulator